MVKRPPRPGLSATSAADQRLDGVFSALADPTRRAIVARLSEGESSVGELAEPFDISLPAVSKHLKVLEGAGLLARERDGRVHRCRLEAQPLGEALEWIAVYGHFWETQLDSLERFLAESAERGK
jgi:DNA-binding transcriptional ArsR family regulator